MQIDTNIEQMRMACDEQAVSTSLRRWRMDCACTPHKHRSHARDCRRETLLTNRHKRTPPSDSLWEDGLHEQDEGHRNHQIGIQSKWDK